MSKIEWTGETWNPIVGCSVHSPGCRNCYAMTMAARLERMGQEQYVGLTEPSKAGPVWTGKVALVDDAISKPIRRRKPTTYFVCSMSDLFHEDVPDEWIDRVFAVMATANRHTYQVLTKRSNRMRRYLSSFRNDGQGFITRDGVNGYRPGVVCFNPDRWPLPNVWLGVSCEDQRRADERVPDLLNTPAAVRFVSAEPLLGPIDFGHLTLVPDKQDRDRKGRKFVRAGVKLDALQGRFPNSGLPYVGDWNVDDPAGPPNIPPIHLDWIIVGGESGHGARPMDVAWAHQIVDQCRTAGVSCFVKQLGAVPIQNRESFRVRDRKGGDMSEWPDDLRIREMPAGRRNAA